MNKPEKSSQADDTLQRMRTELQDLLSHSPGARGVLLHLASMERALKTMGAAAFDGLPSFVLKRATDQLESVLPEPMGQGIAELRARMVRALAAHEHVPPPATTPAHQPIYFSDEKLEVSEATVTEFMRVVEASERKF
jgi:hypothetical protein